MRKGRHKAADRGRATSIRCRLTLPSVAFPLVLGLPAAFGASDAAQAAPDAAGASTTATSQSGPASSSDRSAVSNDSKQSKSAARKGSSRKAAAGDGAKGDAAKKAAAGPPAKPSPAQQPFDIDEYRVTGADKLPQEEVEEAVYPYLGPKRSAADVEKARGALEKAYHDKGFQTVIVSIPQQDPRHGFVYLKVTENKVGRVRITGSRYFDTNLIKKRAPSVAEGTLPNVNAITSDIVALNQWPDRRVTPALRAGATPGTVDVDLNVEDKVPFHGIIELNNRESPNTVPLRTNVTLHYDNLWQLGHSLSFTYQVAPQDPQNAQVFSGSYLAHLPGNDFLSLMLYGVKSNSNVALVGGLSVVGPGDIIGTRAILTLPSRENFFHTISVGADYKHFEQTVMESATGFSSPITYVPLVATYNATFQTDKAVTQMSLGATVGLRGLGSGYSEYETKRDAASGNFFHVNLDVSHTHDLANAFQLFLRLQGQIADQPLVSSEQMAIGGQDTVRGYLESEVLGDNGVTGTIELRTPNLFGTVLPVKGEDGKPVAVALLDPTQKMPVFNEWRFFGFFDAGAARVQQPLSEQQALFGLYSLGAGTRLKLTDYVNGSVWLAVPMLTQAYTRARDPRVGFRVWSEF